MVWKPLIQYAIWPLSGKLHIPYFKKTKPVHVCSLKYGGYHASLACTFARLVGNWFVMVFQHSKFMDSHTNCVEADFPET
jgi:hypothetical protein